VSPLRRRYGHAGSTELSPTQRDALDHLAGVVKRYPTTGDRWYPSRATTAALRRLGLVADDYETLTPAGHEARATGRLQAGTARPKHVTRKVAIEIQRHMRDDFDMERRLEHVMRCTIEDAEMLGQGNRRGMMRYNQGKTPKEALRDDSGQYAVGYDRPCVCGHTKGQHAAGAKGRSNGPCISGDFTGEICNCERFKAAKA
jgi:hypothetical protein